MTAIPAHTVANLRDLGSIALAGGGSVRSGLAFRSGMLDRFDAAADPVVAALGIRTVVDFRTEAERRSRPDRVPAGGRLLLADVFADQVAFGRTPAAAQLKQVLSDPAFAERELGGGRAQELFARTYRAFVGSDSARHAYGAFLGELAEEGAGPLLFHCTAGKDRTGWATTILLTLLGATPETVEAEYLSVNTAVRQAFASLVEGFTAQGGDPEIALAVIGVFPEYLAAALDEVAARHGTMERYVREGLGVPPEAIERIRERLTTTG
ncbi:MULTISPECIES: tyrosine-protein phosphatase [unclassified Streptomyces]|uniref:tyrosine-protein phosphatase n=1 Tax=unclassified Streptomyces TaxID=2593676 RepID=UPI002DD9737F|nr:tyrosine-protein phosphatase [Streptomyces sp. NBC_01750]WSB03175.1 tyrosine-protein phosphatase [Streptomyces sp. NBC_01794]WSD32557.1 tyrosine-protein phosphatase [Streptomyces sp. NBC_01750]